MHTYIYISNYKLFIAHSTNINFGLTATDWAFSFASQYFYYYWKKKGFYFTAHVF